MENKVILDNKEVTLQELQEVINNPSVQIRKIEEGVYKTFQRLQG